MTTTEMEVAETSTRLTERDVIAAANRFIVKNMPDRFSAGWPKRVAFPTHTVWMVPVFLTYPGVGSVGEVGMIAVKDAWATIVGWTPIEDMLALGRRLYTENKREIELAFS